MKWIKASERLPVKCGVLNSVIIRGNGYDLTGYEGTSRVAGKFVTYGFRNYDEITPQLCFSIGTHSFLHNNVEWLDESPVEAAEGLKEKEIERLKGLLEKYFKRSEYHRKMLLGVEDMDDEYEENSWNQFCKQNNIEP